MVLGHLAYTLVSPPKQAASLSFVQEPFPRPKRRTFDVQNHLCTSQGVDALWCEENTRAMVRSACARRSDPSLIRNDLVLCQFTPDEILADPREVQFCRPFHSQVQKDCGSAWTLQFAPCKSIGREERCNAVGRSVVCGRNQWRTSVRATEPGFQPRKQCVGAVVLPQTVMLPFPCLCYPDAPLAQGCYD